MLTKKNIREHRTPHELKASLKAKLAITPELDLKSLPESFRNSYRVSRRSVLLHGYLHVQIIRAKNLRNVDFGLTCSRATPVCGNVSDPYVTMHADTTRLIRTSYVPDDLNPTWNQDFIVPISHYVQFLEFRVKDWDNVRTQLLGKAYLPISEILRFDEDGTELRTGVHKVEFLDGKRSHGSLEYFVEYLPSTLLYDATSFDPIVPGTYFRPRSGNKVRFYIDADANENDGLPEVKYGDNNQQVWKRQRCWRDIYESFVSAKHFIYVTGWSVDHKQSLLRGEELIQVQKRSTYSPLIGELLKKKASEGVVVNLLVWDDATSNMLNHNGVMGTQDEELRRFFADSSVTVKLVAIGSGEADTKCGENTRNAVIFTHHQKSIICDDGNGGLVGYVGGIDLTAGRYDTRKYPLFRSLQHAHADDFYSNCAINTRKSVGPREPWHDIHSRVEGPAAIDLLQNFEERWRRQAETDVDKLIDIKKVNVKAKVTEDKNSWTTQLFRSIDARTALFDADVIANFKVPSFEEIDGVSFDDESIIDSDGRERNVVKRRYSQPQYKHTFTSKNAEGFEFHQCLHLRKGLQYDPSCEEALIYYIRNAQHSVYIESQYFLSSSHIWSQDKATKCDNLIAAELTWKICSKIENGERFAAYIVVPMWPEGVPESHTVQDVLHLQSLTVAGMYKHIARSIARVKQSKASESASDIKPTDYLNFYCLANRETEDGSQSMEPPRKNTWEEIVCKTRRHLIYVHAKMAIFDDAVALIGSANINQRSLSGTRDTELSQAFWQTSHQASKSSMGHGEVHAFRLQCWVHTTGIMDDVFRCPSSLDCVRRVNDIAEDNWKRYVQEAVCEMDSYLVPYPIKVSNDGTISARTKDGCFPDTKAKILGRRTILPKLLTT